MEDSVKQLLQQELSKWHDSAIHHSDQLSRLRSQVVFADDALNKACQLVHDLRDALNYEEQLSPEEIRAGYEGANPHGMATSRKPETVTSTD